jgi:hypothetical protein
MTDGNGKAKARLASTYTWLVLGWTAIGLAFAPLHGDTLTLAAVPLLLSGIVFSFIALVYAILGVVLCKDLRRRFTLPLVLSAPPVLFLVVSCFVRGYGHPPLGQRHMTQVRLSSLKTALEEHKFVYGRFPAGDDTAVISALRGTTTAGENPRGLRSLWVEGSREYPEVDDAGAFLDAWRQPILLEWDDGRQAVVLRSRGQDGLERTGDDLTESINAGEAKPQQSGTGSFGPAGAAAEQ